ncbi:hypothetical protein ACH9EU_12580 [Kocuria sp. M1R5S2]|uniref:hypothetical protein n=1 Tax=Kocuria rhizosphaerae TaxID=3376285 RepID=UPI0037B629A5
MSPAAGALLSAAVGAGLVGVVLGISLLVVRAVTPVSPTAVAPALAVTYLVKAFVLGWILLNVPRPPWLEQWWLAGAVLLSLAGWLTAQAVWTARASRAAAAEPAGRQARAARHETDVPGDAPAPGTGPHQEDGPGGGPGEGTPP